MKRYPTNDELKTEVDKISEKNIEKTADFIKGLLGDDGKYVADDDAEVDKKQ